MEKEWELIKQVCSNFNGNLHQHTQIQQAIMKIEAILKEKEKNEPKPK